MIPEETCGKPWPRTSELWQLAPFKTYQMVTRRLGNGRWLGLANHLEPRFFVAKTCCLLLSKRQETTLLKFHNSPPENRSCPRKEISWFHLPTIHFQGLLLLVSGSVNIHIFHFHFMNSCFSCPWFLCLFGGEFGKGGGITPPWNFRDELSLSILEVPKKNNPYHPVWYIYVYLPTWKPYKSN